MAAVCSGFCARSSETSSFENFFARFLSFPSRGLYPMGPKNTRVFFHQSVTAHLEQERTIVLYVHDCSCRRNCKSLLLNTVHLLSTDSVLPLSDFSPFVTLDQHACLNPSLPGFEVASSDHLINVPSCHWSSISDTLAFLDLVHPVPQSEAKQTRVS